MRHISFLQRLTADMFMDIFLFGWINKDRLANFSKVCKSVILLILLSIVEDKRWEDSDG